jgi:hypothetical protein
MKYQRTRKAVLHAIVAMLSATPKKFGGVFQQWCLNQIKKDYPLFYWALRNRP